MPANRMLIADLGDDWVAPFVSIVGHPAVPKAKWFALKSQEYSMTIAAKSLTQAMRDAGLSDRQLAEKSQVNAASIRRYRAGLIVPPASVALRLSKALKAEGVPVEGVELLLASLRELLERAPSSKAASQGLLDPATGDGRSDVVTALSTLVRIADETDAPPSFRAEVKGLAARLYTLVAGELEAASKSASTDGAHNGDKYARDAFGRALRRG